MPTTFTSPAPTPLAGKGTNHFANTDELVDARSASTTRFSTQLGGEPSGPVREIGVIKSAKTVQRMRLFVTFLWVTAGLCVPLGCAVPSFQVPAALAGRTNRQFGSDQVWLLAIAETFERQGQTAKANEIYSRIRGHSLASKQAAGQFAVIAARQKNTSSRQPSSVAVVRRAGHPHNSEPTEEGPPTEFVMKPSRPQAAGYRAFYQKRSPQGAGNQTRQRLNLDVDEPADRKVLRRTETPSLYDDPHVESAASMMGWTPTQQITRNNNLPNRPAKELPDKPAKQLPDQVANKLPDKPADNLPKKLADEPANQRPGQPADQPVQPNPFAIKSNVRQETRSHRDNRSLAETTRPEKESPHASSVRIERGKKRVISGASIGPERAFRHRESPARQRAITKSNQPDTGTTPQDRRHDNQTTEPATAVPVQPPVQNPFAEATSRHSAEKHYGPVTRQCRPLKRVAEETLQSTPGGKIAAAPLTPKHDPEPLEPKPHTIIIQPAVHPKRKFKHVLPPATPAPLVATGNPFAPQAAQTNEPPATVPVYSRPSPPPQPVVVDEPRKLEETEAANYLPGVDIDRQDAEQEHQILIIPAGANMKRRLVRAHSPRREKKVVPSSPPLDPAKLITSDRFCEIHTERVLALLKQLENPDRRQRALGAYELGQTASEARTALPVLRSLLRSEGDALTRLRVAEAIARIAPHDEQAIAVITDGLSDIGDWKVRELSACLLDVAGPQPNPQVVIKLIGAMNDYHPRVRTMAALTLGSFGSEADAALPRLRAAAKSDVGKVKEAAAAALNVIESKATGESG